MNIKIEKEKKVYVAPFMDVVNMDHELILCCSGCGGNEEEEGEDIINATRFKFEFN